MKQNRKDSGCVDLGYNVTRSMDFNQQPGRERTLVTRTYCSGRHYVKYALLCQLPKHSPVPIYFLFEYSFNPVLRQLSSKSAKAIESRHQKHFDLRLRGYDRMTRAGSRPCAWDETGAGGRHAVCIAI
eukprot:760279-Hanusia_phi.AAC.2